MYRKILVSKKHVMSFAITAIGNTALTILFNKVAYQKFEIYV